MDDSVAVAKRSKRSHGSGGQRWEQRGGFNSTSGTGQANTKDKVSF